MNKKLSRQSWPGIAGRLRWRRVDALVLYSLSLSWPEKPAKVEKVKRKIDIANNPQDQGESAGAAETSSKAFLWNSSSTWACVCVCRSAPLLECTRGKLPASKRTRRRVRDNSESHQVSSNRIYIRRREIPGNKLAAVTSGWAKARRWRLLLSSVVKENSIQSRNPQTGSSSIHGGGNWFWNRRRVNEGCWGTSVSRGFNGKCCTRRIDK